MNGSTIMGINVNNIMAVLLIIGLITLALLPVILFFKIWNMTNDVAKIKDRLEEGPRPSEYQEAERDNVSIPKKKSDFWRIDKIPFVREREDDQGQEKNDHIG